MPIASVGDFLDTLGSVHLLDPQQLAAVAQRRTQFAEPQSLAQALVRRGWLTPYQVEQLFQGRANDLLLGSYVVIERIGGGGMGDVFKARNWKLGQVVALKVIRKDRLQNPNAVRRFEREVRAAAQLSHPNIVKAFDADQVGQTHFIAMELVEGTDLGQRVKQTGPLPLAEACEYIRQAALGLQHAHERGMVHRDIKPSNLLVSGGVVSGGVVGDASGKTTTHHSPFTVKLLDMGLARMEATSDDDSGPTLTQDGAVVGTLDYLSPEQAMNSHTVDIRADLYSLGCTFYYLLTGKVPFPGTTATEKLLKHRLEEAVPVEKVRPDVPPPVAAMVRKLMAKRPEDRFQRPADVVAAIDKLRQPQLVRPPSRLTSSLSHCFQAAWQYPRLAGGIGAVLGLLLLVVLVLPRRDPTPAPGTGGKPSAKDAARIHPVLLYEMKQRPADAELFQGHYYKFFPDKVSWADAQARCKEMGGYLVCVQGREENGFLGKLASPKTAAWLGGSSDAQGKWSWLTGDPFAQPGTKPWWPGQMNNGDFAYLQRLPGDGIWHDVGQEEMQRYLAGFICEWEF